MLEDSKNYSQSVTRRRRTSDLRPNKSAAVRKAFHACVKKQLLYVWWAYLPANLSVKILFTTGCETDMIDVNKVY